MEQITQDIRFAVRTWVRTPALTAAVVLTLALGIGANTAIFSVVNAVLLRPLPYEEPGQLVRVYDENPSRGFSRFAVSLPNFADWRAQNDVFQEMAAYDFQAGNLATGGEPRRVTYSRVTPGLSGLLGVVPALGRTFRPDEDQPGRDDVLVLSHGFWQEQFGGDHRILGTTVRLHGESCTIVGVLPPGFRFPTDEVALWRPLPGQTDNPLERGHHYLNALARMKPGVTLEQAQAGMSAIAARLVIEYPNSNEGFGVSVVPMREAAISEARPAVLILWAAVALVLMIACANVSNLLLAQTASRRKELAIRGVLGAGRPRLLVQLLTEALIVCVVSGLAGLALASWSLRWLSGLAADALPRGGDLSMDGRVLAFTAIAAILTALLVGVAPALGASRVDLNEPLKEGGRTSGAGAGRRVRKVLVVSEVAIAVLLAVGAVLLIRSFAALARTDPGFDPADMVTFRISLPEAAYPTAEQTDLFHQQLLERLEALPQVESAAVINQPPLAGDLEIWGFAIEGRAASDADAAANLRLRTVSPGYFTTMKIPLQRGRLLTRFDARHGENVLVVSRAMAERFWPGEDPVGQRLRIRGWETWFGGPDATETIWWRIVGVVGDVPDVALDAGPNPIAYMPYAQYPDPSLTMSVVARATSGTAGAVTAARGEVLALDGDLPIFRVRTMDEILRDSVARRRVSMLLLVVFAAAALVLAVVGIYGVVSYSVAQRTHEIGVRLALGARPRDILVEVVGQSLLLGGIGAGIGLAGALLLTRFLESLLFGVAATDPATLGGVPAVLILAALAAAYLPARRAAITDPVAALRYE